MRLFLLIAMSVIFANGVTPAQAEDVGFGLFLGNSTSTVLKTEAMCNAIRFTAGSDITVDTLHFQVSLEAEGQLRLLLCEDDGFSSPTMESPLAQGTTSISKDWVKVSVKPVQLKRGELYYLVIQPVGEATVLLRTLTKSKTDVNASDGMADPERAQLVSKDGGKSWPTVISLDTRAMMYGVSDSKTGNALGQPYGGSTARQFGSTVYEGQRFVFESDLPRAVEAVTVRLRRNPKADQHGPVTLHMLDAESLKPVWSAAVPGVEDLEPNVPTSMRVELGGAKLELDPGKAYILAATSPQSTHSGAWWLDAVMAYGEASPLGASYQQDEGYSVRGSWRDGRPAEATDSTKDLYRFDTFFQLHLKD